LLNDAAWRSGEPGLFGRHQELKFIRSFLGQAAAEGSALLLSGEPGVGKTVLLDAAAQAASAAGVQVLRAAGVQFEASVSFSGLNQLLIPLRGRLDQLSEAHRDALSVALGFNDGPPSDRVTVSSAVLMLLRAAAAEHPVLICVDDLPWLDRASAVVLGSVARRVAGHRMGVLAASRSGEESFFDRTGIPGYEVQPLDDEAATGLVTAHFPELTPRIRRRLLTEAQGNPLALLELPAVLSGPPHAGLRRPAVLPLSSRLQDLFVAKVSALPARTRYLLLLAVLDGTGDLRMLQAAASGQREVEELAPAERARLVRIDKDTGRLTFQHPLTRSAVIELSTSDQRRLAHGALAGQLASEPERQAWHLAEAAIGPDEHVARVLEHLAGQVLRRGDAVGAVAALLRSADMSPLAADRSRRTAAAAYVGADVTGDLRSVSQLLAEARRADPGLSGSLQAAVAAAYLLLNSDGDIDTAHRLLAGAIGSVAGRPQVGDDALEDALYTLLLVCVFSGRAGMWDAFHDALARLAPRVSPDMNLLSRIAADPARTAAAALGELDAAVEELNSEVSPMRIIRFAGVCGFVDRLAGCRTGLWRMVRDAREGGAVASGINALNLLGRDGFRTGQWDQAQQLADEGVALCDAHGYLLLRWMGRHVQALLAAARGDYDTTVALADEMIRWASPRQAMNVQTYGWLALELAALGRGDFEAAYQHANAVSPAGVLGSHQPYALFSPMDLVEAAMRTNRRAEAAAHVEAMRAAGIGVLSSRLALQATGSAAIAAADDSAPGLFEAALTIPGAASWPFDFARVQLLYGERLRRARATTQARVSLGAALGIFADLGARPWAQRAASELRAAGMAPDRADRPGPSALTPQEREIALLAAAGLTNKQIAERLLLSHRTIGAHLSRVFPKLGITSRAALRSALGPVPAGPVAAGPMPGAAERADDPR
jgi:DNA-binding CsgD family transcriptional regulator